MSTELDTFTDFLYEMWAYQAPKTVGIMIFLWLIFLWFSNVLLRKPLASLASAAEEISLENLDSALPIDHPLDPGLDLLQRHRVDRLSHPNGRVGKAGRALQIAGINDLDQGETGRQLLCLHEARIWNFFICAT